MPLQETPHVATELKRLQKKHKSAQKTLEKRQQQAAQTLVAELDEEEVDEISRLEEELEAEKARRIAILDENLSDALAAAPTDATKQELQQQYSSDKAAIENSIERDRAARQEQIKAKLAAKKVKKQKILDEKHDEETKLERMTQEAEEDDLKRLMMDASQNQVLPPAPSVPSPPAPSNPQPFPSPALPSPPIPIQTCLWRVPRVTQSGDSEPRPGCNRFLLSSGGERGRCCRRTVHGSFLTSPGFLAGRQWRVRFQGFSGQCSCRLSETRFKFRGHGSRLRPSWKSQVHPSGRGRRQRFVRKH